MFTGLFDGQVSEPPNGHETLGCRATATIRPVSHDESLCAAGLDTKTKAVQLTVPNDIARGS